MNVFLSSSSVSQLLSLATEMFTWFITQMGSLVTFITTNPIILVMFLILLCGSVIGMFARVWHSV